ncbi:MarR family winged helix-turn-helix transcriptional regulator [Streptomyces sp. NPDC002328]|uniref:MarR family winged helix-turn-helix transcriptional regulator n=1 Tax=Streptomyces sp. NPDC002328 TaxID=3364642 RepID=UPI00368B11DF
MSDAPPSSVRSLPGWLLGRAAVRGRALVGEALAGEGIRMWHHVVLSAVRDLEPVAQADLGRGVGLDPKDLVGVLNDLQTAGLAVREPDPADRRKNAVSLTTDGERLLRRCDKLVREADDAMLAPLSTAERDQFMCLLNRISGTDG